MTPVIKLYPGSVYDSPPTHFHKDVEDLCEKIHNSFHSFSSDKDALIRLLADKSAGKRADIYYCYKAKYDKELHKVVDDKIGGDLGLAFKYLCLPLHYAEAHMLRDALSGIGSREHLVYPIICGRDNREILKLKETYFELFNEDLGVRLASELSGDFERLIFWSLQGNEKPFDAKFHSASKAEEDADAFYKAGQGKLFGTDEASLFKIIATSPPRHLEQVNQIYVSKHERSLISALEAETGGDVEKGATFAVGMKLKPHATVARYIHERCAGLGTDEDGLTCALIRYQGILQEVNTAYEKDYHKTLKTEVKSEVGGKYETLLLTLLDDVIG